MQSLALENYGTVEMSSTEMVNVDGGFIPLLIIGCALLLSGCATQRNRPNITHSPNCADSTHAHADSTSHR